MTGGRGARQAIAREYEAGNWIKPQHVELRPGQSKLTVAEASAIQSYPEGFVWAGNKSRQYLQIANAVPPLLAEAILAAITTREINGRLAA